MMPGEAGGGDLPTYIFNWDTTKKEAKRNLDPPPLASKNFGFFNGGEGVRRGVYPLRLRL